MQYNEYSAYISYVHDCFMRVFFDILAKPMVILDFGCGSGVLMDCLSNSFYNSKFVGFDINIEQIAKNKENFPSKSFFAGTLPLPFPKDTYDMVYMIQVMHHIDEAARDYSMQEIHRVLKPGGYFVCFESNSNNIFEKRRFIKEHGSSQSAVSPSMVYNMLERHGFHIITALYLYPWLAKTYFLFLDNYLRKLPLGQLYCIIAKK